jgi:hypothetical protein
VLAGSDVGTMCPRNQITAGKHVDAVGWLQMSTIPSKVPERLDMGAGALESGTMRGLVRLVNRGKRHREPVEMIASNSDACLGEPHR